MKKNPSKKKKRNVKKKLEVEKMLQSLWSSYTKHCDTTGTKVSRSIQNSIFRCINIKNCLAKVILEESDDKLIQNGETQTIKSFDELPLKLAPVVNAIRECKYEHIKDFYIWNIIIDYFDIVVFSTFLEKIFYPIRKLEFLDCMLDVRSLTKLMEGLCFCPSLSDLVLDFNNIGDEGCCVVSEYLAGNRHLTLLSMRYCNISYGSSKMLADSISSSAIKYLIIDGNDLQCRGLIKILSPLLIQVEIDSEKRKKAALAAIESTVDQSTIEEETKTETIDSDNLTEKKRLVGSIGVPKTKVTKVKSKKKKRGKKKKKPIEPPRIGPWIHKIHVADNGIDTLSDDDPEDFLNCLQMIARLIAESDVLEEIDLDDNLIGDVGPEILLNALKERKETNKLRDIKLRTTHRMSPTLFKAIRKYASGMKKKKKKKRKK